MDVSGERQRRLKVVRANKRLRKENQSLEDSIPGKIVAGIEAYVGGARELMAEYETVTREIIESSLQKRILEIPEKAKASYIPNSVVLPLVLGILSEVDRNFRKAPISIWAGGENIYSGSLFHRICKLGTLEIEELIKENADELNILKNGKTYVTEREGYDLVFHPFFIKGFENFRDIGVYAIPNEKEKEKLGRRMRNLGNSTIERLQKLYDKLITPEGDYGAVHGAV